jgi:hypothetical protein
VAGGVESELDVESIVEALLPVATVRNSVFTESTKLIQRFPGARCIGQAARIWGEFGENDHPVKPRPPAPKPVLVVVDDDVQIPAHLIEDMKIPPPVEMGRECEICYEKLDPENHAVLDGHLLCFPCQRGDEELGWPDDVAESDPDWTEVWTRRFGEAMDRLTALWAERPDAGDR